MKAMFNENKNFTKKRNQQAVYGPKRTWFNFRAGAGARTGAGDSATPREHLL